MTSAALFKVSPAPDSLKEFSQGGNVPKTLQQLIDSALFTTGGMRLDVNGEILKNGGAAVNQARATVLMEGMRTRLSRAAGFAEFRCALDSAQCRYAIEGTLSQEALNDPPSFARAFIGFSEWTRRQAESTHMTVHDWGMLENRVHHSIANFQNNQKRRPDDVEVMSKIIKGQCAEWTMQKSIEGMLNAFGQKNPHAVLWNEILKSNHSHPIIDHLKSAGYDLLKNGRGGMLVRPRFGGPTFEIELAACPDGTLKHTHLMDATSRERIVEEKMKSGDPVFQKFRNALQTSGHNASKIHVVYSTHGPAFHDFSSYNSGRNIPKSPGCYQVILPYANELEDFTVEIARRFHLVNGDPRPLLHAMIENNW